MNCLLVSPTQQESPARVEEKRLPWLKEMLNPDPADYPARDRHRLIHDFIPLLSEVEDLNKKPSGLSARPKTYTKLKTNSKRKMYSAAIHNVPLPVEHSPVQTFTYDIAPTELPNTFPYHGPQTTSTPKPDLGKFLAEVWAIKQYNDMPIGFTENWAHVRDYKSGTQQSHALLKVSNGPKQVLPDSPRLQWIHTNGISLLGRTVVNGHVLATEGGNNNAGCATYIVRRYDRARDFIRNLRVSKEIKKQLWYHHLKTWNDEPRPKSMRVYTEQLLTFLDPPLDLEISYKNVEANLAWLAAKPWENGESFQEWSEREC